MMPCFVLSRDERSGESGPVCDRTTHLLRLNLSGNPIWSVGENNNTPAEVPEQARRGWTRPRHKVAGVYPVFLTG